MRRTALLCSLLFLAGCSSVGTPDSLRSTLTRTNNTTATPQALNYCHGGGCVYTTRVKFTDKDWQNISKLFRKIKTPEAERSALIKATQQFENLASTQASTSTDKPGTFSGGAARDQLDCHDEMLNTAVFLHLLQNEKLLKFHTALGPAVRGHFIFGWPHTAMALQDTTTQNIYILDTWENPLTEPPLLLPENDWRKN